MFTLKFKKNIGFPMKTPTGIQKNKNVNFYQPITLRKHYFCKNNKHFKELT